MKLPPDYISGFIDGEGSFGVIIYKHPQRKLGVDARLSFEIELRDDDLKILTAIQRILGCGRIYHLMYERYGWFPHAQLKVSSFAEIRDKLIPFLKKHPLYAKKKKSFGLFCKAAGIFDKKEHLTEIGLRKLYKIKEKMNKYSKHGGIPSFRQGAGKPRARREEKNNQVIDVLSQNTAHQASKVGST